MIRTCPRCMIENRTRYLHQMINSLFFVCTQGHKFVLENGKLYEIYNSNQRH